MFLRSCLMPVALVGLLAATGCTRAQARRAPRPFAPSAAPSALEYDAHGVTVAPTPPDPPVALSTGVTPPRADALAGNIPPLRDATAHESAETVPPDRNFTIAAGPLRDRIQKRREQRQERREERQDEKKEPAPAPPAVPSEPAIPKPTANTEPTVPVPPGLPTSIPGAQLNARSPRQLVEESTKRWATITDFEARLVKREVVNGKTLPKDELEYRYRRQPMSVYMRVLSEAGQGREVLYVHGSNENKMHVVTGKGDNIIVGAGYKTEVDPDSRTATSKSRHRIYDAGMGRTIAGLTKNIENVKSLGRVQRTEYPYPLEGVEQSIPPQWDPLLPQGGRRQVYFDPKADSPSYLLPVLVITYEPDGREVEYYCFDRMKVPAGLLDTDWSPDRLGKRR